MAKDTRTTKAAGGKSATPKPAGNPKETPFVAASKANSAAAAANTTNNPGGDAPGAGSGGNTAAAGTVSASSAKQDPPAKDDKATKGKKRAVDALFIQSVSPRGFRRCGFGFNQDGVGIALDALTAEQIDTLQAEPNLVVTETTIEVDE